MRQSDVEREINNMMDQFKKHAELEACVKEFFETYLNRVEESDSGYLFHPITVSCCRAAMLEPLDNLLKRMAQLAGTERENVYDLK